MTSALTVAPVEHTAGARTTRSAGERGTAFLDGLRGLAALYVVIHHAAGLLYRRLPLATEAGFHPASRWLTTLYSVLVVPFRRGDVAVQFFFVLSGFVIHLRSAQQWANDRNVGRATSKFGWGSFVFRRFRRLYPPLLFALVLTVALDALGRAMGYAIYAHATPYPELNLWVHDDYGPATVVGNLLFGMHLYVPALGSDGPLWSLAFEWWFYMLYPLLWLLGRRSAKWATAAVLAAYVWTFFPQAWPWPEITGGVQKVFMRLPAWWAGALLAEVYVARSQTRFAALIPLLLLTPTAIFFGVPTPAANVSAPWTDAQGFIYVLSMNLTSLGFVGLLALCFWVQRRQAPSASPPRRAGVLRGLEKLGWLGGMSYTLYVIHLPILILLTGWFMARSPDHHLPHDLGTAAASVVLVLILAWAAHWVVERPFVRTKHRPRPARPVSAEPSNGEVVRVTV